jgi:hypothetical protein
MIYLTATGWPPGGSSSVHIHTNNIENDIKQTIHRTQKYTEHKKYIEHKN